MTDLNVEFFEEQMGALETQLATRTRQYHDALESLQALERVVSQGAVLASHVAYLCSTLPEGSVDIEQASQQLHELLTHRQP